MASDHPDDRWATKPVFVGLEVAHGLTLSTGTQPYRPWNALPAEDAEQHHRGVARGGRGPIRGPSACDTRAGVMFLGPCRFDPMTTHGPEEHGD